MAICLLCPRLTCRTVLSVPDEVRGKRIRCGECGITFLVPDAAKPAPTKPKPVQKEASE